MALEYFPCYHSYFKKIERLSDQEVGRLFRSLLKYAATGEREELAGRESIAFDFIVDDIDRAEEQYQARCEKNRANRASASERPLTTVDERPRPLTNVDERDQTKSKSKTKTKSKEEKEVKEKAASRFTPPTLDEVKAYVSERKSSVDPVRFWQYYDAGGWKDAKGNEVKNWKQKLLTWEKHDAERGVTENAGRFAGLDSTDFL